MPATAPGCPCLPHSTLRTHPHPAYYYALHPWRPLLQQAPLIPGLLRRDEAYSGCLHGILEAAVEDIDASVVNTQQAGLQIGQALPRGGERISLTVRRVMHTYSLGLRL